MSAAIADALRAAFERYGPSPPEAKLLEEHRVIVGRLARGLGRKLDLPTCATFGEWTSSVVVEAGPESDAALRLEFSPRGQFYRVHGDAPAAVRERIDALLALRHFHRVEAPLDSSVPDGIDDWWVWLFGASGHR